jgi:uncharacterized protein YodC (DUF2158 family)
MEVKAGDVVHLRSGGPAMTVVSTWPHTSGYQVAVCMWFDKFEKREAEIPALGLIVEKAKAVSTSNS